MANKLTATVFVLAFISISIEAITGWKPNETAKLATIILISSYWIIRAIEERNT